MNEKYYAGKPVESLQYMLRILSKGDDRLMPVIPDGIFGQSTALAVTAYQRSRGLPATGAADLKTWESIVQEYKSQRVCRAAAEPLQLQLEPDQMIAPGERNTHVRLIQAMLLGFRDHYGCLTGIEVTGVMDAPTVAAVRKFQSICGLPSTGAVDRVTWQHMARQYPCAAGKGTCSKK